MSIKINMRSAATLIKGQGVGSCFEEQVRLVKEGLPNNFEVHVNSPKFCQITHYHTINPDYFLERILKKNSTVGIGYVHFLPDTLDESLTLPKWFRKIFYKYLLSFYNSMDYLITVNPSVIKKLEDYKVNHPKILYIPNFVSEKDFYEQDAKIKQDTRQKYGIDKNKFVVMCAGQLQTRKGVLDFVKVAEKSPEVQFIWAGGFSFGKISDGYQEITKILNNPPKNVNFLGIIDREEMINIYNMADVMFLPSFDELFPMTILEALCCKTPILLRDVDIYEDILFDYYLKGKSIDDFVNIINRLRTDKDLTKKYMQKSWECHMLYSKNNILHMWEKLYAEAAEKLSDGSLIKERKLKQKKDFINVS